MNAFNACLSRIQKSAEPVRFRSICWLLGAAILLLSAVGSTTQAAAPAPIAVGPDFVTATLSGHMVMLRDPGHRFDLQQVAFGAERDRFEPAPDTVALGYTREAVWFRVRISRQSVWPPDLYLRFQPNYLDSIRIFVPRTGDPSSAADFRVTELGDHARNPRRVFFPPFQAMRLTPPSDDAFDVFFRVETSSSLIVRGQLATRSSLSQGAAYSSFSYGAAVAFLAGLGLLHFYHWTRYRQSIFFWFSAFLLSLSVTVYSMGGFDVVGDNRLRGVVVSDYVAFFAVFMIHFFGLGFMLAQTEAKTRVPWLYWLTVTVMGFILVSVAATLFGFYRWVIEPNLAIVTLLLIIFAYVNVRQALEERVGRTISAIACLVYAGIIVPYDAGLMGLVTLHPLAMSSIVIGSVFFIALMTISLMQRAAAFERLRKESEELRIARRAQQAASDLVDLRTAQLVLAKEEAETALAHERAAQREQLRFVDVVTHQYQTPLAIIRSSVTAIRYALAAEDEANRQRVSQIEAAVLRLVEIMDVSLHRSRMDGHAAKAAPRSVPVVATVTEALTRSRDLLPGRTILSRVHRIDEPDRADLDPDMLAIALLNLVDNAAKFSEPDRPILVRVSRAGTDLVIEVEDEGIGIPSDEIDNVSERYFRASNAGNVTGTGLGLSIVRQIASAHQGTFRIEPRAEKGVIVRLTIPAF